MPLYLSQPLVSLRGSWLAALSTLLLFTCPDASAQKYTFTRVIEDTQGAGIQANNLALSINNRGELAFSGSTKPGFAEGVYKFTESGIVTVAGTSNQFERAQATGLNDLGTVVFVTAYENRSGSTIFQGSAAPPAVVADSMNDSDIGFNSFPAINNAGLISFVARNRIMLYDGTSLRTIVSNTEIPSTGGLNRTVLFGGYINESDAVVFSAYDPGLDRAAIYVQDGANRRQLFDGRGDVTSGQSGSIGLNDQGDAAFLGKYPDSPTREQGIFVISATGALRVVARESQGFRAFDGVVSINNSGKVVFHANTDEGLGFYTGPDPVADKVIATGDTLFGTRVSYIYNYGFGGRAINDRGQIPFVYQLNNGRVGIAIATPVAAPPVIGAGGLLNGASFQPVVSPGSILSIFGQNLADSLKVGGNPLPTDLAGTSVTINGQRAPIYFVSPGQINVQVPFGLTGSSIEVRVTVNNLPSNAIQVALAPQTPAIFTSNQQGTGQAIAVFANTATLVGPTSLGNARPAQAGDVLTLYLNGLGAVSPPIDNGSNSCTGGVCAPDFSNLTIRNLVQQPVIEIGGIAIAPGQISFAGLAPEFVGLYQINFTLPSGLPVGDSVQIRVHQGTNSSPANVTIALR